MNDQGAYGKIQMEEVYGMGKRGLAAWEEYRNIVRACRDATRKAKTHLELNLLTEEKDKKKSLFEYVWTLVALPVAGGLELHNP